ncbi:MFS transporter [Croceicoccus sp. BE223]|uniref:MFS transporter n=1 Tax=Croceicoccus sp. BE223 TaxID=2817716 RepID=UPI00286713A7|nr:MFS transporter [Croceicoccus sp. BE223]MDR7103719.1 EmrB/QacA subfamily drug resistance transporter [Croceicoccus sp. BE223]
MPDGADKGGGPSRARGRLFSSDRLIPVVIASALFMDLMDTASLALALPTIARDFAISTTDLRIALTVYAMTVAVIVPASAWVAGRFGARRVFVCAMIVFVTGSILCGLSDNLEQMVAARVLQGMGGAMMTPVGRAIMVGSIDRSSMVKAMAWFTMPAILAPMLGPPLAGVLIETASWRWIFFINLPVGLLGIVAILRFVPSVAPEPRRNFDLLGFVLCAGSVLAILGVLESGLLSGHSLPVRIAGVLGAVTLVVVYVRQALRSHHPLIDLRVLRHRTLGLNLASGGLQRVGIGAITIMLPMQLQVALGFSPLAASQVPAAGAIGSLFSRFACPPVLRLIGFKPTMVASALVLGALTLVPIAFRSETPLVVMSVFMIGFAVVRASFFMSGNSLSYADVEGAEIGHASVLFSITQQVTLGLGYTLGGALIAGAGGAREIGSYAVGYGAMAFVSIVAALIVMRLPRNVGEDMRREASA